MHAVMLAVEELLREELLHITQQLLQHVLMYRTVGNDFLSLI